MDPITDGIVGAVTGVVNNVIERLFPDPEKQAEARLEFAKMQQNGELAALSADVQIATNQSNTNTEEAKSTNMFIAGWRPFIGWTCGSAFAIQFVVGPLGEWFAALAGKIVHFPTLDLATMTPVILGMLGLGGMRTFEKWKGSEGNR